MEPKTILDQTKDWCRRLEIIPTRSKGQNFLVSREVLDKIVAAANLGPKDSVLEIGPGLGILTEELVKRAGRVVAVELDKKLFDWLQKKFKGVENLNLVEGDILKLLNDQVVKLLGKRDYKVVANLPYQITAHVLRLLLESARPPQELILMVQKEVGERICAKQGEMSVLSVMAQYYGQPELVVVVGRENFWPVPAVDSAIIKIKRQKSLQFGGQAKGKIKEELFFKLVKVGFSGKRKMLKNNLRNIYKEKEVLAALEEGGLDMKVRAEDLGVEEWIKLYNKLRAE